MGVSIATAPCCWAVDDVRNPNLPPWELVFDEVAAAGYQGLKLGPYGYVPLDLDRVSAALERAGSERSSPEPSSTISSRRRTAAICCDRPTRFARW